MEDEILFFVLARPRSVSDMIRELTEKELSKDPGERSEQIPRIAGNWFKKDRGYLWRLQDQGKIRDIGRQYAVDRPWFVDALLEQLGVPACFPAYAERGDAAVVSDAYGSMLEEYTYGGFRRRLLDDVFLGDTMAELFSFDTWSALRVPETDARRIARSRLSLDFWSTVHFSLITSILKTRFEMVTGKVEEGDEYFRWRNRRQRLVETVDELRRRIISQCFPGVAQGYDGAYQDERVNDMADAFASAGPVLSSEQASLLADMYLLGFQNGVDLFKQYVRYDHDVHLLFNLFEQGWLIEDRTVDRDPRTGNVVVPLGELHSYLDALAGLFRRNPSLT